MTMLPTTRFGRTGFEITRIALGGYPFGGVNRARGWDPFTAEGRSRAIATIRAALDAGINMIDTAPGYGKGNSESIIGEATRGMRDRFTLATKVTYRGEPDEVNRSVEASLRRLETDHIDVIQFHGGFYTSEQVRRILEGGLIDRLEQLRDQGKVRFLGFTVEEPWTGLPLIESGRFDVVQVRYNLIYQGAALHLLKDATEKDMGVSVMRPMTSGILQRLATYIAPEWDEGGLYGTALKFVLSDSRVHTANVGMRSPAEVETNVALATEFLPSFDVAELPRMTAHVYQAEDADAGLADEASGPP
jgi:aryl-alcohol dehydrogenase-like predicted oxidoreductase